MYRCAWRIDHEGTKAARGDIAAIKVAAPLMATQVIERAIEIFGAAGVSDDTPLAYFYAWARALRIVAARTPSTDARSHDSNCAGPRHG